MKFHISHRVLTLLIPLTILGLAPLASAASSDLSVATTSLGKIVVNAKGMTAYFYDLDKANSNISQCTGACLSNWPKIISITAKPKISGISGKITLLPGTKQIAINGRPIYTFAGDSAKGATNGQGVGGIWYAISPSGVELNPTNLAKLNRNSASPTPKPKAGYLEPSPSASPSAHTEPSHSPTPTSSPTPTNTSTSAATSGYDYNY